MAELEHQRAEPKLVDALRLCHDQQDDEVASSGVFTNPLCQMAPNADVGDKAYDDGRVNGPGPGPLGRFLWPPPKDLFDVAAKAGLTVSAVFAALTLGRSGIRAVRGAPKTTNQLERETPHEAPTTPASTAIPRIVKGTNEAMLRQAIDYVKNMSGTAAQRVATLEDMLGQIHELSKRYWRFAHWPATDGSHVFFGGEGEALIVNPQGKLFLGNLHGGGIHIAEAAERVFQLDFSLLRLVQ